MDVAQDLQQQRAEVKTQITELKTQIAELKETLAALDRVLSIYGPPWTASMRVLVPRKAKSGVAAELRKIIGGANKRRMTLHILRTAGRPRSAHECAEAFAISHKLAA